MDKSNLGASLLRQLAAGHQGFTPVATAEDGFTCRLDLEYAANSPRLKGCLKRTRRRPKAKGTPYKQAA